MALRVGDVAPDFELEGIDGRTGEARRYSLAEFRGTPLILAFYPADNSPVCTRQLVAYTDGIDTLNDSGIQLVAISPQDTSSHVEFSEAHGGFAFPMLSDLQKDVGRQYGVLGLLDLYRRSIFLIDGSGVVRYSHRSLGPGVTYRPLDQLVALVTDAQPPK